MLSAMAIFRIAPTWTAGKESYPRYRRADAVRERQQCQPVKIRAFFCADRQFMFGKPLAPNSHTQFIAAKVSTTGRLLTLMMPIPG
jgi:hypothetical protein